MNKNTLTIWIVVALAVIIGLFFWLRKDGGTDMNPDPITANWESFSDLSTGVSFRYPEDFSLTYVHPVDWPPAVQLSNENLSCTQAGSATERAGRTEMRIVVGEEACVTEIVEGAAGSLYTQYAYAFNHEETGKTLTLTFSTRHPQCGNYPEPEMSACENELASFDMDTIMGNLVKTVVISTASPNSTNDQASSIGITPQICTMEAKLCPDGSYVGRSGPNCAFAPCPGG